MQLFIMKYNKLSAAYSYAKKNGSLSTLMIAKSVKDVLSTIPLLASLPVQILKNTDKDVAASPDHIDWEEEREDILERANWLCQQVIKDADELVSSAPSIIGRHFQCEWAIYSCSMLTHALANISAIYPDKKEACPELIAKLIDIVNTPTIRHYDTSTWGEDAMETLDGAKHHMTYLSILAWMISNYKLIGGDERYDDIFHRICEALNRRMHESPYDLNLLSFPRMQIWLPDMLVTIVALKNYSRIYNGKYGDTVDAWIHNARTKWLHKGTGLLSAMLPGAKKNFKGKNIRGSHVGLSCSYLALIDEEFARDQYEKMNKLMMLETTFLGKKVYGIREYLNKTPQLSLNPGDAGLVVKGISAGGTAFALGAATFFGGWESRYQMLRTAEIAGGTVKQKRKRHYRLGETFLVGEATALAMRTQINRY